MKDWLVIILYLLTLLCGFIFRYTHNIYFEYAYWGLLVLASSINLCFAVSNLKKRITATKTTPNNDDEPDAPADEIPKC